MEDFKRRQNIHFQKKLSTPHSLRETLEIHLLKPYHLPLVGLRVECQVRMFDLSPSQRARLNSSACHWPLRVIHPREHRPSSWPTANPKRYESPRWGNQRIAPSSFHGLDEE